MNIIGVQVEHSNLNMYSPKQTILAKDIKEDPIKDDFYDDFKDNFHDDFEDDFYDSINESGFSLEEVEEAIENTRKRKFDSSSITDQSIDIKKSHLELNNDQIEDDFYIDYDDVDFNL
uniref:Highly acidic protein n=1 Tax=Strongyloides venezuelensis TaxID=75913 RepID=A0A0K0EUQ9_STRVS